MLKKLRALIAAAPAPAAPPPGIPAGERVYAIGDVHGRADLMADMIELVEADDAARAPARDWGMRRTVRYLQGNHEEMFLSSFTNDNVLRHFLRFGGRETLLSYPITPEEYHRTTLGELQDLMAQRVPRADIAFMAAMENMIRIGDYVFVHAGIRPGVALDEQVVGDLRWIRGEFLDDASPRDFAVVHGHTITPAPEVTPMRIGIDTGAYASGQLTAIGLQGTDRWLIATAGETRDEPGPG